MLDFDKEENAIYLAIYPFVDMEANKGMGIDVLEEASECREAYDQLAKMAIYLDENETENKNDIIGTYINSFICEACDAIQAIVNLVAVTFGSNKEAQEAFNSGLIQVIQKNVINGYYGEQNEEDVNGGDDGERA